MGRRFVSHYPPRHSIESLPAYICSPAIWITPSTEQDEAYPMDQLRRTVHLFLIVSLLMECLFSLSMKNGSPLLLPQTYTDASDDGLSDGRARVLQGGGRGGSGGGLTLEQQELAIAHEMERNLRANRGLSRPAEPADGDDGVAGRLLLLSSSCVKSLKFEGQSRVLTGPSFL